MNKFKVCCLLITSIVLFFCSNNSVSNKNAHSITPVSSFIEKTDSSMILSKLDSFKKFSYLLILMNNKDTIGNATGFFVKKCNHLYLFSNFHVLANKEFNTLQRITPKWNHILIRYKKNKKWSYYSLDLKRVWDIVDLLKKPAPQDVWHVEIPELLNDQLDCIDVNNNALNENNIKIGSNVFVYGFPAIDFKKERNYDNRLQKLVFTQLTEYDNGKLNADNVQFKIKSKILEGQSGSPAFAYSNVNDIRFLGLMFASGGDDFDNLNGIGIRNDVVSILLPPCTVSPR